MPAETQRPPPPPTVRQAIDSLMTAHPTVDPLTMLMLGRHLGPATRLTELDKSTNSAALERWVQSSWGDQSTDRRTAVAAALTLAVDHWREQGWLLGDPVAFLRFPAEGEQQS